MPLPIFDDHHSPISLRGACVGLPVSAMHCAHHVNSLARLIGRRPHYVASGSVTASTLGVTTTTKVAYRRSPGAQVLLVEIELWQSSVSNPRTHVTASIVGGSAPRIVTVGATNELNGSTNLYAAAEYSRNRTTGVYRAWFDVSALSTTATVEVVISHNDFASTCPGIRHFTVCEVPMASFDPVGDPTNEMGVDPAWAAAGNDIYEGASTYSRGYDRVIDQLDKARTRLRRYLQAVGREDTAGGAYSTNSTSLTNLIGGTGTVRTRVRRLRKDTVSNPQVVYVRYLAQSGATLRLVVTAVGKPATNYDIVLPATAGSFTSLETAGVVSFPTDGTLQEVDVKLQAKTALAANPVYLSLVASMEDEV